MLNLLCLLTDTSQDSRLNVIRAKESPCGAWPGFLVGQKWSSKSPYVARIILPCVIYENVDVVFIEIYQMQVFWKSFSW
jgi:hypothetical protein